LSELLSLKDDEKEGEGQRDEEQIRRLIVRRKKKETKNE